MAVIKGWTKRDGSADYKRTGDSKTMTRIGGAATSSIGTPGAGNVTWPGRICIQVPLIAASGGGGMLSVANQEGEECVITKMWVRLTTASGGVATADFGVAANGTTLDDDMLDGLDINTTGIFDSDVNRGTNGLPSRTWSSTQFVTGSIATGAVGSVVGWAMIEYFVP